METNLLRYKEGQIYMDFDTETEGLNLISSRPWQVAWILFKVENGKVKILKKADRYIAYDDLNLSDLVKKLTGYSDEVYHSQKQSAESLWEEFSEDLFNPDHILVGQNLLGFDIYMIAVWMKMMGLKPRYDYMEKILDTRALSIAYKTEVDMPSGMTDEERCYWQMRLIKGSRFKRLKVSQIQLLKDFEIPFVEKKLHNAIYDVEKNCEIFAKLIWRVSV